MARTLTIIAFLLVLLTSPILLLVLGLAPAMTGGFSAETSKLKQLLGHSLVLALWLVPVWIGYFGWRSVKAWKHGGSTTSAVLMMLPSLAFTGMILWINLFGRTAP